MGVTLLLKIKPMKVTAAVVVVETVVRVVSVGTVGVEVLIQTRLLAA